MYLYGGVGGGDDDSACVRCFVIKGSKMQAKSVDRTLNLVVRSG